MNEQSIIDFKTLISNLSVDELLEQRAQLNEQISKMIFESDVTMKIAIVEAVLTEKLDAEAQEKKNG